MKMVMMIWMNCYHSPDKVLELNISKMMNMIIHCLSSLDKVLELNISKMIMIIHCLSSLYKVLEPISECNISSDQQLQRIQSNFPNFTVWRVDRP